MVRGWLGVYLGDLTESLREAFKSWPTRAARWCSRCVKDGPAEKAGVQDGDIILEFDGTPVEDGRDLRFRVAEMRPGTRVELLVLRDGERQTMHVELGELPDGQGGGRGNARDGATRREKLGFTVEELTRDVRSELQLDPNVEGVVVTQVEDGSEAEDEGMRQGDVIVEVGRRPVADVDEFRTAVRKIGAGEVVLLTVYTDGNRHFVALRMPQS